MEILITDIDVKDIRFPTSLLADGSDAMHTDPDYSCAYVTIKTNTGIEGYGLTFTLGRGTEIVVKACKSISYLVKGHNVNEIFAHFGSFWRKLTSESQLRWIGPEKGVIHLATAAVINALWDLWARIENKPVWKLLTDLTPEELVSTIDFRYITDVITKEEAIKLLKDNEKGKEEREELLRKNGYPAYTTQVGWLGYSDRKVKELCVKFLDLGFTSFKAKVGQNLTDDIRRCELIRDAIGYDNKLMLDANQIWDVNESIEWMKRLIRFKPIWIEEPTSPDDVLGHAKIANELRPFGIGVATGEMCANRVIFKQLLQAKAIDYCQIDSARIGGINEVLAVYLMAKKMAVPVCPHAGGVGLCEMVQHLQMWDYICLSATTENRVIEYVEQQHEHFEHPVLVQNACYMPPTSPGYSTKFNKDSIKNYSYPDGEKWKDMYEEGLFQRSSH
ncbi:Mitochondrial enolase superfamily member 1 [Eufriesea mexicana]|uniref:mitochondrial enolase superfamily member 1-like n=1 Tax=Eufriesea mexicana TaxID=516756 RepID=UPI00083C7255|nr:PREDICTED: mitochondrial enolase superfamily member 1-like [Eufriesea mexicana]OAD57269.1 Mitochondrial enolase superfamily member 1 [Eufriesea mexicana]